jgi:hypothetical protein
MREAACLKETGIICVGFTCPKCKGRVSIYRILPNKPTPHPIQEYVVCSCGYTRWCGFSDIAKLQRWIEAAGQS